MCQGENVHLALDELADSLPGPIASLIRSTPDSSGSWAVLTPVRAQDGIIGVVSVSSPALDKHLVRSVEALSRHIGIALERADELRALVETDERYRSVAELAGDAIFVIDREGTVRLWNRGAEEIFGYRAEEIISSPVTNLMPERDREGYIQFHLAYYAYPGESRVIGRMQEAVGLRKNDEEFPMKYTVASFESGTRRILCYIIRDITERKRMEQEIAEYTSSLETAYQELLELDAMKDSFLSTVSHELRTPLTSIRGFSEILLGYEDVDKETQREFMTIINSESERLTRLINDVLDLARIQSGRMHWAEGDLEINEAIDTAVDGINILSNQKYISVRVDLDPDLPPVWSDKDKLVQVVTNLLSNAIKFTPEEGEIWVQAKFLPEGSGMVQVSVSDTGIGIAPEDQEKVFEKFRQMGDTLSDKPKGTGLGLPICKEILEHYGGRIWVESELGKGSTFFFTLPVARKVDVEVLVAGNGGGSWGWEKDNSGGAR